MTSLETSVPGGCARVMRMPIRLASNALLSLAVALGALRAPPPRLSEASQREAPKAAELEQTRARMVICVNTNICGKPNPTYRPGYGFAYKALDALSVLGPPWMATRAGPCFVRCSSGVNARLVGSKKACADAGVDMIRSRDLFRLNAIDDCVKMLEEELEWQVDRKLLPAYRAYAEAEILMDEQFASIQGVSFSQKAGEALPLLDKAASYIVEQLGEPIKDIIDENSDVPLLTSFARVSADIASGRSDWIGSKWRESFYETQMAFVDGAFLEGDSGHSSESACATYGKRVYGIGFTGSIQGVPSGRDFRGTWREQLPEANGDGDDGIGGDVVLRMSADGLGFEGVARVHGEDVSWQGERIPDPPMEARPENIDPRQRWYALVLTLRSRARLTLRMKEEALRDAVGAARLCLYLPEAWDAIANAALELGDKRTSVIALSELWWLQPKDAAGMPSTLLDRRREQGRELEKLRSGMDSGISAISLDEESVSESRAAAAPSEDGIDEAMLAIFANEYVVPEGVE